LRVTLLGFGTVGQGLALALAEKRDFLERKDLNFDIVAVADSRSSDVDPDGLDPLSLIDRKRSSGRVGESRLSGLDLVREVESDVVIEVTPGNPRDGEPALSHIREALRLSRHVVSANKMPLALHFAELIRMAKPGVSLRYSACVGGGIPMLETGMACRESEEIVGIDGVLNATSNFILTKMEDDGYDYVAALREAQSLGYAEADPSLDVDGFDAAAKLVILANRVMGRSLTLADVRPMRGIRNLTLKEIHRAGSRGKAIRPLATMRQTAEVGPKEVDPRSPLNVFGATNVVVFRCEDSGDRVVAGASGGGVATSRAVLRDLVVLAREVGGAETD
jgi:homoserine dehydrogenase